MINLFNIASNDQSINYLRQIFGNMHGVIPTLSGGADQTSGGDITILSTMFKTFNSVILAIGALIVIYVTIMGVIKTAHEGEFMGKQWNSIFIPLRMVIGIASLVPLGSGYSALQIVMMWVIVQGIGAADSLWNTVLGYVDVVGSPFAQVSVPSIGANQAITDLFKGIVCDSTARFNPPGDGDAASNYYCKSVGGSWCSNPTSFNPDSTTYTLGPNGACGTLTYCDQSTSGSCADANSLACQACKAQVTALSAIIPTLTSIAQLFVQADYQYRDFYARSSTVENNSQWQWIYDYCSAQNPPIPQDQCCVPATSSIFSTGTTCQATGNTFPSPNAGGYTNNPEDTAIVSLYWPYALKPQLGEGNFADTAVKYYMGLSQGAVTTYIQAVGQDTTALSEELQKAQATGWIFAGSYYYTISEMNNSNFSEALPTFTMSVSDPSQNDKLKDKRNNFNAAATLISAASGSALATSSMPQLGAAANPLVSTNDSVTRSFASTIEPGTSNPLVTLQGFGTALLVIVTILYPILIVLVGMLGLMGFFDIFVLGTGAWNPVGPALSMLMILLVPVLFALLGLMVSLGATLAIYVPLIPYVIFTFGAIGWLISCIETMVAGPLVALGILSPSGQHEILGASSHALMLLFNNFLRPTLMIFGLIAAMLLATVVVSMVNYAFWTTVAAGIGGAGASTGTTGMAGMYANPLELAIFVMAYVSILVAALNKCFQAIHIIPERVMRWIGGQGEQYGEGEALHEMKGAVDRGAAGARGGAEAARGKVEGAGAAKRKEVARVQTGGQAALKPKKGGGEGGDKEKPEKKTDSDW